MALRINLFVVVGAVFLVSTCLGQQPQAGPVIKAGSGSQAAERISFPYTAEVIGSDVYVRSGPGTAYYFCGKLSGTKRVTVVGSKLGWSKIVPPEGSFSWISKTYVRIDPTNPSMGIVTGDLVRVWAGSESVEPMRSSSQQTKLNGGDIVKLMGEEKGDYYKIAPPPGAHLWISSQFLKYVDTGLEAKPQLDETKPLRKKISEKTKLPPSVKKGSTEDDRLRQCYELAEQINAELKKPVNEQDYKAARQALNAIVNDTGAGKAGLYARYQIERISRFELARISGDELQNQDRKLADSRKQIKKDYSEKLAGICDTGKFIATGRLNQSYVFTTETGQKRYLIKDKIGKIVCYAIAVDNSVAQKADRLLGQKVGLDGKVVRDAHTSAVLVRFTEITVLKSAE